MSLKHAHKLVSNLSKFINISNYPHDPCMQLCIVVAQPPFYPILIPIFSKELLLYLSISFDQTTIHASALYNLNVQVQP
jgi:hypothetical protein